MFSFKINIDNPLVEKDFNILWSSFCPVTKNRTLEYQFNRVKGTIFCIEVSTEYRGRDHAGPYFEFGLLGWSFIINLPDNRHWDDENNTWATHDE